MNNMGNGMEYMRKLLWRRGFRGRSRLAEAEEMALHLLTLAVWRNGGRLPEDWRVLRPLLDKIVYRVERELKQAPAIVLGRRRSRRFDDILDLLVDKELTSLAIAMVERLAVRKRLICKLKHADAFYPRWAEGELGLRPDEKKYVRSIHGGRSLKKVMEEFRDRLTAVAVCQEGKVPSEVIAWLLGRRSADAVDTAYQGIKRWMRNAAPPGAVFVLRPCALGSWPAPAVAA
jgi:hypothetical protein